MQSAEQLGQRIGVQVACAALIVPRSSLYRARRPRSKRTSPKISPRAFSQAEKITVRQELNSERFQDRAPREVYAALIDEGRYLCSWRSMYRILAENDEVRERRNQLRHPKYSKPELLASVRINCGVGIHLHCTERSAVQVSQSCWDRPSGPITTCMSFWMCSAAMWSVG